MKDTSTAADLPSSSDIRIHLAEVQRHLAQELVPFWSTHGVDEQYGGFLTYFDRYGHATGETIKTLICQARMIYAFSYAHRRGYGDGYFLEQARKGADFLINRFWDAEDGGWMWTCERDGTPLDSKKIVYGQSFAIYALAELTRASADSRYLWWAIKTFDLLHAHAIDRTNGGYYEFFEKDWHLARGGEFGGDRKSLDVHMHLMEAFTNLYAASADASHARAAEQVSELIRQRMLDPVCGTGLAQFSPDFTPLRAIIFKNVWGSDRDAEQSEGRPIDNTSYGHNVELGWLLGWSLEVRGASREAYHQAIRLLYDHALSFGIDWARGGLFCEGPGHGPARERNKEFWQQAEMLVAMLDGLEKYSDPRYWSAYVNIHSFVMDHVINHDVGEWFALLSETNDVIWDYMGHAWKINYHTLRSMLECEQRLERLAAAASTSPA